MSDDPTEPTEVDEAIERARELIRSMPTDELAWMKLVSRVHRDRGQAAGSPSDAIRGQAFAIAACDADRLLRSMSSHR